MCRNAWITDVESHFICSSLSEVYKPQMAVTVETMWMFTLTFSKLNLVLRPETMQCSLPSIISLYLPVWPSRLGRGPFFRVQLECWVLFIHRLRLFLGELYFFCCDFINPNMETACPLFNAFALSCSCYGRTSPLLPRFSGSVRAQWRWHGVVLP